MVEKDIEKVQQASAGHTYPLCNPRQSSQFFLPFSLLSSVGLSSFPRPFFFTSDCSRHPNFSSHPLAAPHITPIAPQIHTPSLLHSFIHSFIPFTAIPSPHSFITSSPHTLTSIHSCTLPLSRPLAPEELQRVNTPTNTETPLLSIRTRASLNIRR